MIAFDLQWMIYFLLLLGAGGALFAVALDRRRFRHPLLVRSRAGDEEMGRLLDAAPFGLMLLDDGACRYANVRAGELLGWRQRWGRLPQGVWRDEMLGDLQQVRRSAEPYYRLLHLPDGRSVSWWLCPLPEVTLAVVNDHSGQARLERASRAFLGTLSHELRTPLAAILAHLAVVQGRDVGVDVRRRSLAVVQQEAQRLARLVQDLLQLGRLEMSENVARRPLDLALVAEAAIAEIIPAAEERGIALSLESEMRLPRVLGDGDSLQRVFLNLLDNSVKYCEEGDEVTVRLTAGEKGVEAAVRDSGPGISPEHLPHVTERLYRGRTDVGGSGLGLALVAEILRQHDSGLHLSNGEDGGVVAHFVLPLPGGGSGVRRPGGAEA